MTTLELAYRSTTEEACLWLTQETQSPWDLAKLIENGLIAYVWLDYDPTFPELFGDANGGYSAPILFEEDTKRIAAGSEDVLITFTKDADKIAIKLPAPGIRKPLEAIRFLRTDLNRLVQNLKKTAEPAKTSQPAATESKQGILKEQIILAFGKTVKIDLSQALSDGIGIFGDDGARIKKSRRGTKNPQLWNPVTLALGLHDVHRAPMAHLKRAFETHEFLEEWNEYWLESLAILGE